MPPESSCRPVISVALATYNGARFLPAQLESIYQPCSVPIEVVAVDDGSSDDTLHILRHYAETRGLRMVSDGKRRGLVKNFEYAISHCGGDYIALSDQDDVWLPGRLDFLLSQIQGFSVVYSMLEKTIRANGELEPWPAPPGLIDFVRRHGTGHPTGHLLASNWVVSHTMLLARNVVEAALPIPDQQPYHDAWLAVVASTLSGIKYVTPNHTLYRSHPASFTAAVPRPVARRWGGVAMGLSRTHWLDKCRGEITRLSTYDHAAFLPPEQRRLLVRLKRYYQRGLRRGFSLRTGLSALRLVRYFQFSGSAGFRRKFILRGFFGAI